MSSSMVRRGNRNPSLREEKIKDFTATESKGGERIFLYSVQPRLTIRFLGEGQKVPQVALPSVKV